MQVMSTVPGVQSVECATHVDELIAKYSRRPTVLVMIGNCSPGRPNASSGHLLRDAGQRQPNAAEAIVQRLVAAHPQADVVVFGESDSTTAAARAVAAGARGYLRWDGPWPAAGFASTAGFAAAGAQPHGGMDTGGRPSERELQVLQGMSRGMSNAQIGHELRLSQETIKTHARRLFRKLGVSDRAHAVAHGFRHNLVS